MNRLLLFVSVAFLLIACSTDTTDSTLGVEDGATVLTLSIDSSRTSLGDKVGDTYPVYWSDGDRIVVNGILSEEAVINASNHASAQFSVVGELQYPYYITYPYTSTTTAETPKVVFPAEQEYAESSFGNGSAPMCGYLANEANSVTMKHLAGALRLPVKASVEGIVLEKIVITSATAKLSGEYSVDCTSGAITPSDSATNVLIYNLPANFTLSTTAESVFYVALPAVNQGECTIEFVEASGKKMTNVWNSTKPISAGMVREFSTITYKEGFGGSLISYDVEEDDFIGGSETYVCYGAVKDSNGNPIEGVAVSDGYSVVTTDNEGRYMMNVSTDAWYIYVTVPAAYALDVDERNVPCFYQKYSPKQYKYDFVLTPLAGGAEQKFALFAVTDIHLGTLCNKRDCKGTFENKVVPHINGERDKLVAQGIPSYGINLGDYISSMGGTVDDTAFRGDVLLGYKVSKVPFLTVMGNHDHNHFITSKPLVTDERNSTANIKAQREHEDMFGPANFSFDRGDVHIVGMRNTLFPNPKSYWDLIYGYTPEQVEWLRQDLALVPKDKLILLCIHVPMFNYDNGRDGYENVGEVRKLLNEFDKVYILSGHTHYQRNIRHTTFNGAYKGSKIIEHNIAPVSGSAWNNVIAGDGTPAGYKIYHFDGANMTSDFYVSYNEGENGINHQMRLYWGNAKMGAPISGDNANGTKGFYAFNVVDEGGNKVLLANIYNAMIDSSIKVYENGTYAGTMKWANYANPKFAALVGDGTFENPKRAADGVETAHDFYATGYMLGYLGLESDTSGAWTTCFHMFKHTLKDNDATVMVEVTDTYGNVFTETVVIGDTDFSKMQ